MTDMAIRHEGTIINERRREMHNGRIVFMAQPKWNHQKVSGKLFNKFSNHSEGKDCEVAMDGTYLILSEKNRFVPDMMVICDKSIIKEDGVHGAPDLVVEVLSLGTKKRDRGFKKKLYERHGINEYWLVDIEGRAVEVYLLYDGVLELDNVYVRPHEFELEMMTDEERSEVATVLSPVCFPELELPIDEIFEGLL